MATLLLLLIHSTVFELALDGDMVSLSVFVPPTFNATFELDSLIPVIGCTTVSATLAVLPSLVVAVMVQLPVAFAVITPS